MFPQHSVLTDTSLRQDPSAAADELERTVKQYGFLGALINNTSDDGSMYDDEKFWPVFERAVQLDVPIYIHPSYPPTKLSPHYGGNFSSMASIMMSTAGEYLQVLVTQNLS